MFLPWQLWATVQTFFHSHEYVKTLFQIDSSELKLLYEWFLANKLSLNAKKIKHVCFYGVRLYDSVCMCDSIPLQLPTITFNNNEIKRR